MNKLGICVNFWENSWNVDHIKYIKKAGKIGFDILEFQAQTLLDKTEEELDYIKKTAREAGVELTYSLGLDAAHDVSSMDVSVRRRGIEYSKRIFDVVGKMEGKLLSGVCYAGWLCCDIDAAVGKRPLFENSVESMKEIIKAAEDNGVCYAVEPVNRFEGCLINTAWEAREYIEAVDSTNIGILLDTYHMNIEENSFTEAIHLADKKLWNVHTGDNNRRCPGRGHIDFHEIFRALSEIDYQGRIIGEPFVATGGEVGHDIALWRNLETDMSEEYRDREAAYLLEYEKRMIMENISKDC